MFRRCVSQLAVVHAEETNCLLLLRFLIVRNAKTVSEKALVATTNVFPMTFHEAECKAV